MNLAELVDTEQTYKLELKHPTKPRTKLGVYLTLRSSESDEVAKVVRNQADKMIEEKDSSPSTASLEDNLIEQAAATIAGFDFGESGFDVNGKTEYSPEAAKELVKVGWIYEQVMKASQDRANFIQGSNKN